MTKNTEDAQKEMAAVEAETKDEIHQLMSEIQELQKDMATVTDSALAENAAATAEAAAQLLASPPSPPPAVDPGPKVEELIVGETPLGETPTAIDEAMEDTLAALKADDDETPPGSVFEEKGENMSSDELATVHPIRPEAGSPTDGSLTMTLTGNMTLKLKYEFEGREVEIGFVDQALKVSLSDGTEFKIPVGKKRSAGSEAA